MSALEQPLDRVNYFNGQRLDAADFRADQDYQMRVRRKLFSSLYSIVAYVWSFVTATEYIPYLSEKWVELKDASRRITATIPAEA